MASKKHYLVEIKTSIAKTIKPFTNRNMAIRFANSITFAKKIEIAEYKDTKMIKKRLIKECL